LNFSLIFHIFPAIPLFLIVMTTLFRAFPSKIRFLDLQ